MKINGKTITPERLIEIAMPRHAKQIKEYMRPQTRLRQGAESANRFNLDAAGTLEKSRRSPGRKISLRVDLGEG